MSKERAIQVLFDADIRLGNKNEQAISNMLENEDYEALSIVKNVFDKQKTEMPIPPVTKMEE